MSKKIGICVLCGSRKHLNFANLCKRCNKTPEAARIRAKILGQQSALQEQLKHDQLVAEEVQKEAESHGEAPPAEKSEEQSSDAAPAEKDKKASDEKNEKK